MLMVIEKVMFLQNVDIFEDIPSEYLAHLATIAQEVDFLRGELVLRQGEPSEALYVVLSGEVRLHQGEETITVAGRSAAFGSWALFEESSNLVTATATQDARLLRIEREDFMDLLADHVQITRGILKKMAGRLRALAGRVGPA